MIDTDRPQIFNHIIERFGERKTARVPTYMTLADKAVIEIIVKGLAHKHGNKEYYKGKSVKSVIDKVKQEFAASPEKTKKKYPEIFYYYDGLIGTKISDSIHAAGIVISPVDLISEYGVVNRDGISVISIDMEEIHEVGLAKYDFLVLRNIAIINDAFKLAGKKYPLSHEVNWNDENVWADMIKSPIGIFQMENPYAHGLLKQYNPHSIFDMSLVTAAIRPSGASYRDDLIAHKPFQNPSPIIDELLKDNWGYLVYQEDTIKFLQQVCGLSGSEADNIRSYWSKR